MANFLKKLFGGENPSVLGIDIGSSSIKVVQLRRKGGQAILETYGSLALGPYGGVEVGKSINLPPDRVTEALVDVLREAHISSNQAGLALPYGASLISMAELPAVAEAELSKIIPFEARKYIPVPLTEVMLDWMVIPEGTNAAAQAQDNLGNKQKMLDVLLVAIHNETIARYQTIMTQAGLDVTFFEIEAFSNIRSILDQSLKTEMLIDIGAATTKVYIIEQGIIRMPHIITRGSQDVTKALSQGLGLSDQDAEVIKRDFSRVPVARQKDVATVVEQTMEPLFIEVNQVLMSYQNKFSKTVSRSYLIGGGARLSGILPFAASRIKTEVVLGNPFSKTAAPAFLESVLKETGPEFSGAVGAALRKLQEIQ
jgi:type IV pilus assembly protein PilM